MSVLSKRRFYQRFALMVVVVGATATSVVAASAAAPTWPASGFHPTCTSVFAVSTPSGLAYKYYDASRPTLIGFTPSTKAIELTNTPTVVNFGTVHAKDPCSGVGLVQAYLARDGVLMAQIGASVSPFGSAVAPPNGNYFDVRQKINVHGLTAADAGRWTVESLRVGDRFSDFTLNKSLNSLLDATPRVLTPTNVATSDAYGNSSLVLLRHTSLSFKEDVISEEMNDYQPCFEGYLMVYTGTEYVGLPNQTVTLQRREGKGKWVNVSSFKSVSGIPGVAGAVGMCDPKRTNMGGVAVNLRTDWYRFTYSPPIAAPWNAPRATAQFKKVVGVYPK
jgi:hypothetical protein